MSDAKIVELTAQVQQLYAGLEETKGSYNEDIEGVIDSFEMEVRKLTHADRKAIKAVAKAGATGKTDKLQEDLRAALRITNIQTGGAFQLSLFGVDENTSGS